MSTIINPTHAIFKEGEVYVYTLPEEPKELKETQAFPGYPNIKEWLECLDKLQTEYNKSVAHARNNPIEVHEKDVEKVWIETWLKNNPNNLSLKLWLLQKNDLTEYRIEGLRICLGA